MVLTDHSIFRKKEPDNLNRLMANSMIIDTKNIINEIQWEQNRFEIKIMGEK